MSCNILDICTDDLCSSKENQPATENSESTLVKESLMPSPSLNGEKTKIEVEDIGNDDDKETVDEESHEDNGNKNENAWVTAEKKKRRRNVIIASVMALLVVILIIFLSTTLSGNGDKYENEPSANRGEPSVALDHGAAVDKAIRDVAIFGGKEFEDGDSYQSKALEWLKKDSFAGRRRLSSIGRWSKEQLVQRYALACLYYGTSMVPNLYTKKWVGNWIKKKNWLTSSSECDWYGVTSCTDGMVDTIGLAENGLTGSLPRELTLLTSLTHLDVYGNILFNYGAEGNEWLGDMTSLKYLSYGNNYFDYDGIPTQISKLTNLVEYDCSYTLYFGPLKNEAFEGLDDLQVLDISGNEYNSSVPDSLANLPSLERLYAMDTSLSGSLEFVTKMPVIEEMWVDYNKIDGSIPNEISKRVSLYSMSIGGNEVFDKIPTQMGKLSNLVQLWLYDNNLTGSIPLQFRSLTNLKFLYTSGNDLTGTVSDGICDLKEKKGSLEKLVVDCDGTVECDCCDDCDWLKKE
mmetsp:Transcript_723/g.896  ORF Transcript_723/g.896 Transcript_723/m.896 type:complete len:518 (-) Transcript_723:210-1763(-)